MSSDLNNPSSDPGDDPRLAEALREYTAAVEGGKRPNRQEFLQRHAEIAGELSVCLQGLAFLNSAVGHMHSATGGRGRGLMVDGDVSTAQPLGDFQLIREIGRGGMGIVYEAMQLSLNRRVAVKVLPLAAAMDEKHLQRFKNEAQAAAQLHHTNIVPVYAVGSERSVHFYAMQLIDGQSLSQIIHNLKIAGGDANLNEDVTRTSASPDLRLPLAASESIQLNASRGPSMIASIPVENLSTMRQRKKSDYYRNAARLGLQAAEALEYAHQFGVVHRDIKPANLMLDARANLWITDFGLAQFYGQTGNLTLPGDMLGTLRYMSPEQASGRAAVLDQRTDIYSLGVTLYELVTLERAVSGETREQMIHEINEVEPRQMRSVDKAIPVELQTIVDKAMAKDAADRYSSARAMADDLQRFLRDEPIQARPPSSWDKAVKWTRRHRALAMSAIVMLFLAAVGSVISTILIAREQTKTRNALDEANRSFQQAREAVDFFVDVANSQMPHDPQSLQVRTHLLEVARDYYQSFIDQHPNDAALSAAQANVKDILDELAAMDELRRVNNQVNMLRSPDVQHDLGLNNSAAIKLSAIPSAFPSQNMQAEQLSREKLLANAASAQAALAAALTPDQLQRLTELSRQAEHLSALEDPDVVKALTLSEGQQKEIRKIRSSFDVPGGPRRGRGDFRGGPPNGPGQRRGPGQNPDQDKALQQAISLLTPDQKNIWKQLIGKPFTGDFGMNPFGGPNQGRGPGNEGPGFAPGPGF